MEDVRLPKDIYGQLPSACRPVGRPKLHYKDVLKRDWRDLVEIRKTGNNWYWSMFPGDVQFATGSSIYFFSPRHSPSNYCILACALFNRNFWSEFVVEGHLWCVCRKPPTQKEVGCLFFVAEVFYVSCFCRRDILRVLLFALRFLVMIWRFAVNRRLQTIHWIYVQDIKAAALRTLTSIVHLDCRDRTPRLGAIVDVTGVSQYHGFLPVLVRRCIDSMCSKKQNNQGWFEMKW